MTDFEASSTRTAPPSGCPAVPVECVSLRQAPPAGQHTERTNRCELKRQPVRQPFRFIKPLLLHLTTRNMARIFLISKSRGIFIHE